MSKNPYTGEEIDQEVYDFILKHNDTYKSNVNKLNQAYIALFSKSQTKYFDTLKIEPTEEEVQSDDNAFAEFDALVAQAKKENAYYEAIRSVEEVKREYSHADFDGYKEDDEYKKLVEACEKVGVSKELIDGYIDGFFKDEDVLKTLKDKSKTIGGDDGIIHSYAPYSISVANLNTMIAPNQEEAIKEVLKYACKQKLGSENLEYAGEIFYKSQEAFDKLKTAKEALNLPRWNPVHDPIDKQTYEKYNSVIEQYGDIKKLRDQVKESFTFPKKNILSQKEQTTVLGKYAEARERADSHWGITKFFASLMPGLFKETAKDMADEKFWKETLEKADFTKEDLKNAEKQNVVDGKPENDEVEKNGDEKKGVDVASRILSNLNENNKVKAKDVEKKAPVVEVDEEIDSLEDEELDLKL